ncbi:MAG: short-chain dehydrogenase/reductase [Cenarchaeum symbiont of Oopsacas minuta]|nr:short-chain dehydrogenase/reductase [Cenarchaeum symbiont of Oopsacas minuta]
MEIDLLYECTDSKFPLILKNDKPRHATKYMTNTAFVTGGSSGIGYETVLEIARRGYHTYAGVRNTSKERELSEIISKSNLDIKIIPMDVDDEAATHAAIDSVISERGGIDVLVNNAGYGLFGSIEDISISELKSQFETNFFSIVRIIQQVVPYMRTKGSGHIVNVSSIAGKIGFPGSSAYVSSKFALEGLGECLRYELDQFGIHTIMIEPGVTKTKFFDSMRVAKLGENSPYGELTNKVISGIKMMAQFGTEPTEVAKKIADVLEIENPHPRYTVGTDAAMFDDAKRSKSDIEFENYVKSQLFS